MQLDPQTTGSPGRTALVREFLEFMTGHEGVWFATGSEIYDFCLNNKTQL